MRQVFEHTGHVLMGWVDRAFAENLIMHHMVMSWPSAAAKGGVGLQKDIPVPYFGHTTIDDGAISGVLCFLMGLVELCRVETSVVTFADNNNGNSWESFLRV